MIIFIDFILGEEATVVDVMVDRGGNSGGSGYGGN